MSAITKAVFSPSSMDVIKLESKRSEGNKRGNRPETKKSFETENRNSPGTVFPIQYGPIPPVEDQVPNVMYIDPNPEVRYIYPPTNPSRASSTVDVGKSLANSSISEIGAKQSAAIKTVMSWKNSSLYNAYAEKARGSFFSIKSGPVTYDSYKSVAVGSNSDNGFKSNAVYSTSSSTNNCSIS